MTCQPVEIPGVFLCGFLFGPVCADGAARPATGFVGKRWTGQASVRRWPSSLADFRVSQSERDCQKLYEHYTQDLKALRFQVGTIDGATGFFRAVAGCGLRILRDKRTQSRLVRDTLVLDVGGSDSSGDLFFGLHDFS